jgi:hypothetical protein
VTGGGDEANRPTGASAGGERERERERGEKRKNAERGQFIMKMMNGGQAMGIPR